MLRVGIVGCGKIADWHAAQIVRIANCRMVGVCDREPLMAAQLQSRFPIDRAFPDLIEFLETARPEVVHITTPPQSHFAIARMCLEAGCHVYVEKPFTVYEHEARTLLALANQKRLRITVGHDDQFRNAARRMRSLIASGYLGTGPVHMESYYCYELGRSGYTGALLGDKHHWVRQLPGGLLQNVISHGIARLAEFLTGDAPDVSAHAFVSSALTRLGETELIDELRATIIDEQGTTAYFTFSSQMRPSLHQFRLYGSKNGLILDQDQETLIRLSGQKRRSFLEPFVTPVGLAGQYLANVRSNLNSFLHRDFHIKAGMKYLIESFYNAIREGSADPIPHREILLTAHLMDRIFAQLPRRSQPRLQAVSEVVSR